MLFHTLLKRAVGGAAARSAHSTRNLSGLAPASAKDHSVSPNPTVKDSQAVPKSANDISVEYQEHCKSGSDHQAAELKETAYGKGATEPDEVRMVADGESKNLGHVSNPFDVSSANPDSYKVSESSLQRDSPIQKMQGSGMIKGVPSKQGQCKKYA